MPDTTVAGVLHKQVRGRGDHPLLVCDHDRLSYADFRVVSAVAELAPDRSGFFITFTITEGERYKFGKIDVSSRFQGLDVDQLKSYLASTIPTFAFPRERAAPSAAYAPA